MSFINEIARVGGFVSLYIPVAIGGATQHVHTTRFGPVPLASPAPLGDLRAFIFSNHSLELYQ